jgi:hypothetical protein
MHLATCRNLLPPNRQPPMLNRDTKSRGSRMALSAAKNSARNITAALTTNSRWRKANMELDVAIRTAPAAAGNRGGRRRRRH